MTLECRRGEIFGLLGANGAGKTTTLRMLATILAPSRGDAWIHGHSVVHEPQEVRRHLGFYSASTALYPRLTASETLELFARINGLPESRVRPRRDELIARFGIGKYADARIEKLSTGMKQKVSIARTIAHDPPVLIFDEPTVGLDVLNAIELQKVIAELRDEGKTIVFSTHIMSEAERLCDRIAIIHQGQVHASDSLEGLRAQHRAALPRGHLRARGRRRRSGARGDGLTAAARPDGGARPESHRRPAPHRSAAAPALAPCAGHGGLRADPGVADHLPDHAAGGGEAGGTAGGDGLPLGGDRTRGRLAATAGGGGRGGGSG